jgi:Tol biopolymer transport system component
VQIIPASAVRYGGLTFTQDGNFLYFVASDKENPRGALFQIPVLGGAARRVLSDIQSPVTLSPDGKRFAFVRYYSPKENSLVVTNLDGSGEKRVATRTSPDFISTEGPSWSPDGNTIAYVYQNTSGGYYENVFGIRLSDGVEEPITNQRWWNVGQLDWLSDGSALVAAATEDAGSLAQIWHLPFKGGDAKRLTSDLNGYADVNLTSDSKTMVSVRSDRLVNIWSISETDAGKVKQVTSGFERDDGMRGLTWSPDGRIVYRSVAGGEPNVWIMKPDGTEQRQLTINTSQNFDPVVSPDGKYTVWGARRTANTNLWRMDIDGSSPKQITNGVGEYFPDYTPDGSWILYTAYDPVSGFWSIWKISSDGGTPTRLTEKESAISSVSPDGKFFACNYQDQPGGAYKIAVIPISGGTPVTMFDIPGSFGRTIHWTTDGRSLTYVDAQGGVSNLWNQSLSGGAPKQITDFKDQRIYGFAWSRDGKQLAISRGVVNNDVVLIKDFRP